MCVELARRALSFVARVDTRFSSMQEWWGWIQNRGVTLGQEPWVGLGSSNGIGYLFALSLCLGFVQTLSPDRWVPLSVLSWKRQWSRRKIFGISFLTSLYHLIFGWVLCLGVHFVIRDFGQLTWAGVSDSHGGGTALFWAGIARLSSVASGGAWLTVLTLLGITALRARHLSQLSESFLWSSQIRTRWGLGSALKLMGPAEWLLPLAFRSVHRGSGFLLPLLGFGLGIFVAEWMLIMRAKKSWSDPSVGAWFFAWAQTRLTWAPLLIVIVSIWLG